MQHQQHAMKMGWIRFAGMIAASTVIMFFLMYQLVYSWVHAMFSVNRLVASLVMGCVMTAVMLVFMWPMYGGQGTKVVVLVMAVVGALLLLFVNRSQTLVGDTTFMRSMIPHHSIAINNARKATIKDARVRRLADRIIQGQMKEITEMKLLIDDIDRNGIRGQSRLPPVAAAVPPRMDAEIRKAVR